jgi:DNA helicase-2/ATP-dependent DNA helicase PcrA
MTDTAELEEERRLAYVGITRAQQRLYLTHAWSRTLFGQTQYNPPSRFLGEIPEALLESREEEAAVATRHLRGRGRGSVGSRSADDGGRIIGGRTNDRSKDDRVEWAPQAERSPARHEPAAVSEGDTVVHEKWGEGVVVSVEGGGDGAEATIAFSDVGEKRVLLAYAPLTKLG